MESQRVRTLNFDPHVSHEDSVAVEGLEDLFQWASDLVADGSDPRSRRIKEQRIHRSVLEIIQRNKEHEAREKAVEEISCLQRRVIALLQIIADKMEESTTLKQVVLTQYLALQRVPQLEEEIKQLQALTWYRDEAEAERRHMMDALAKMKKERDFLDELLTINENENVRLAKILNQTRTELSETRNRKWWHPVLELFRKISDCPAT